MTRCAVCDHTCRLVSPTGPKPTDTMLVGEKPGQQEANWGRVFLGDTGKELDELYLPLAGLAREDVYITNTVKCRLGDSNSKPTDAQIAACSRYHLPDEISDCNPSLIILLGSSACSLIPEIELDKQHGMPIRATLFDWTGWVLPMYHPAAGLHNTGLMIPLIDDFKRLKRWSRGLWTPPQSDMPTDYRVLNSRLDLFNVFHRGCDYKFIPIDTESDGPNPWSLQFSTRAGNGYLIHAHNHDLLRYFAQMTIDDGFLLHNAIYDMGVLERMGINVARPIRDTMQEAYQLGNLPQGLKALVYRMLGVRMRDYDDVVMPYSRARMVDWLVTQWNAESDERIRVEIQLKTKVKYLYKPTDRERGIKRILSHAHKTSYDVWAQAGELGLIGYPTPSIRYTPEREMIEYACADSDMTGRIGTLLEAERARIVEAEWQIEEGDEDA